MPEPGPLTEQIAASIEDVKELLDSNTKISIAYLSRRLRDLEEEVRGRLRRTEAAVKKLEKRIDKAADVVKTMKNGKGNDA